MLASALRNKLLPSKNFNGYGPLRGSDYGELFNVQALPANLTAAWEGSMWIAQATPAVGGTGVAMGIQTSFSDTANVALVLSNGETATTGKDYLPIYLRGRITAAGASSTSSEISVQVDNTNRLSSGGTALGNIHCVNPNNTVASNAVVTTGAITAAAAGSQRRFVGQALLKVAASPLWLVNDVILVTFGGSAQLVHQSQAVQADAAAPVTTAHIPMPACNIPAGGSMTVHIANVANAVTPPSIAWEACWVAR